MFILLFLKSTTKKIKELLWYQKKIIMISLVSQNKNQHYLLLHCIFKNKITFNNK